MYRFLAKALLGFLGCLLLLVIVVMGASTLQTYREYKEIRGREVALAAELTSRNEELRQRQEYLRLVLEDPQFLERVVREKLGFARPNETIYRFED